MDSRPVPVRWEVAEDEQFRRVVAAGTEVARAEYAHSVHVDVKGLQPWREYFYRFRVANELSPVGRAKTAPAAGAPVASMTLALASCQAWWDGYEGSRNRILGGAHERGVRNLVSIAGDLHRTVVSDVKLDFADPGVTGRRHRDRRHVDQLGARR